MILPQTKTDGTQTTTETRKRLSEKGRTVSTDRFCFFPTKAFSSGSLVFNFASRLHHFGVLETNRLIPPHLRFTCTTCPDSLLFFVIFFFSLSPSLLQWLEASNGDVRRLLPRRRNKILAIPHSSKTIFLKRQNRTDVFFLCLIFLLLLGDCTNSEILLSIRTFTCV